MAPSPNRTLPLSWVASWACARTGLSVAFFMLTSLCECVVNSIARREHAIGGGAQM